jgi:hypothetical protein
MDHDEEWTKKDVWLGSSCLAVGLLIVAFGYVARRNDVPLLYWGVAWILGPLLILIGGNGIVRSLRGLRGLRGLRR